MNARFTKLDVTRCSILSKDRTTGQEFIVEVSVQLKDSSQLTGLASAKENDGFLDIDWTTFEGE